MQVIKDLIWKFPLENHSNIKSNLLEFIDNDPSGKQFIDSVDHLNKTDFFSMDKREAIPYYYSVFYNNAQDYYWEVLDRYCMENIDLESIWYQQYIKKDTHGWHVHPHSSISFVYNLELENSGSSTEFYDRKNKQIVQLDVNEGDILTFPSYLIHRSAPLIGNRKTIISGNYNFDSVDQSLIVIDK